MKRLVSLRLWKRRNTVRIEAVGFTHFGHLFYMVILVTYEDHCSELFSTGILAKFIVAIVFDGQA